MSFLDGIEFAKPYTDLLRDERKSGESLLDCLRRVIAEACEWRKLGASKPEPSPQNQSGPALWPLVIADLERKTDPVYTLVAKDALERHEFGVKKYGVPLVAHNGRNHLKDAYQEQLDKLVYLFAHYASTGEGKALYEVAIHDAVELRRALEPQ